MPRQGHLEAVLDIMGCTKDHSNFWECDWTDFYKGAVEVIPPNTLLLRGKRVDLQMFVDSDHAGDKQPRKWRTRLMIYMRISLINWCSKKQSAIETSVFDTEFVAMKVRIEPFCAI